jgi:hypothetical protein
MQLYEENTCQHSVQRKKQDDLNVETHDIDITRVVSTIQIWQPHPFPHYH